ncbi:uncharacterized protein RAG0_06753 [Rhynchosporium agropyri]|uniref:Uncharacterized protein n=1 Tax=Rhynchosporium agropyri TaxID=914238 RepID=A0A1E1KIS5_9HELO|nr:uncharacterized protein RAG0_06753 [Rhynchosporium agropyri]
MILSQILSLNLFPFFQVYIQKRQGMDILGAHVDWFELQVRTIRPLVWFLGPATLGQFRAENIAQALPEHQGTTIFTIDRDGAISMISSVVFVIYFSKVRQLSVSPPGEGVPAEPQGVGQPPLTG